ncbi:hypothetical protein F4820DRAFT_422132 [Hypoxylon rubiginosum]|uniref:Uncharacterized protein n=1 Tax=Hypoxylon rubiginosum TaxID=110542 RepID=A0ACB9Z132_9PEZI|nr:hypothetical protein F4820DRAFT_422132 [Hypoxylon rubiginosum]
MLIFGYSVLVSPNNFPRFWIFMYYVSPFTYFLQGLAAAGLAGVDIKCSPIELLELQIPHDSAARTRGDYLERYAIDTGGYVSNPSAITDCQYCQVFNSDPVLEGLGINPQQYWRNAGILAVYVVFNVIATFVICWSVRGRRAPAQGYENSLFLVESKPCFFPSGLGKYRICSS